MKMYLCTPSKEEAHRLLHASAHFRELTICQDSLPPAFLFERAIADNGGWLMPRLFCEESDSCIVGSGAFKSAPTKGRVEIGYGVAPTCCSRGYATAGVKLLIKEAFSSGLIDEVWAETSLSNQASQRVLEKAGFSISGSRQNDEGPMTLWSIKKEPNQTSPQSPLNNNNP